MHMKTALGHLHKALIELAGVAEKIQNQNFADQIKAAAGKVQMAMEHADAEHPELVKAFAEFAAEYGMPPEGAEPFPGAGNQSPAKPAS